MAVFRFKPPKTCVRVTPRVFVLCIAMLQEWKAIKRAKGFKMSFANWAVLHTGCWFDNPFTALALHWVSDFWLRANLTSASNGIDFVGMNILVLSLPMIGSAMVVGLLVACLSLGLPLRFAILRTNTVCLTWPCVCVRAQSRRLEFG